MLVLAYITKSLSYATSGDKVMFSGGMIVAFHLQSKMRQIRLIFIPTCFKSTEDGVEDDVVYVSI